MFSPMPVQREDHQLQQTAAGCGRMRQDYAGDDLSPGFARETRRVEDLLGQSASTRNLVAGGSDDDVWIRWEIQLSTFVNPMMADHLN